ncbi:hypothetical protein HMPREF1982_00197 [Clostridiales bacterium oral taxon 876 str. F0540]|nr:hypothetical protein HMPREF1982_00197 [Clostridiales bacterium oral taxon 876 str. F0540]
MDYELREKELENIKKYVNKIFFNQMLMDEDLVDDLIQDSNFYREVFNDCLIEGQYDENYIKQSLIMQQIWSVTEGKHTELFKTIKNTPAKVLINKISSMLDIAEKDPYNYDAVLNAGKITGILGTSILSEILHKCYPSIYPIKNKISCFSMSFILHEDLCYDLIDNLSYSEFVQYSEVISRAILEYLEENYIHIDDRYGFWFTYKLFEGIYNEPEVSEKIKLLSKKNYKWN